MKILCLPALVAGTMLAAASFAQAQTTATGQMGVSATVSRTCTLSAAAMAFGTLSTTEVSNATALVTLTCNGASTVSTMLVGMGASPLPPTTQRNMIMGAEGPVVPYTLHIDEARTTDIATDGAVTLVKQSETNTYTATLFGKMQPSTNYAMGAYADTVVLTAVYAAP